MPSSHSCKYRLKQTDCLKEKLFSELAASTDLVARVGSSSRALKLVTRSLGDDDDDITINDPDTDFSRVSSYTFRKHDKKPGGRSKVGGKKSSGSTGYRRRNRHPEVSFFDDFENNLLNDDFPPVYRRVTTRRTNTTTTTTTTTTPEPTTTTEAPPTAQGKDWTPKAGESFGDWVGGVQHRYPTKYADIKPNFVIPLDVKGTETKSID